MDTTISVDGGIGRVICSSGAIEYYAKKNKGKTFVVTSVPQILTGMKYVERVYPIGTPFLYQDVIQKTKFLCPEPYNDIAYYKEEKHLCQVFHKLLNGVDKYCPPVTRLTFNEHNWAKSYIEGIRKNLPKRKKKKIILFQPWGSTGGRLIGEQCGGNCDKKVVQVDEGYRSLGTKFAKALYEAMAKKFGMVFVVKSPEQTAFQGSTVFSNPNFRQIQSVIPYCDGIVACDSSLSHASAALGSPCKTIVLWAGTSEKNLGYESHVNIRERECEIEPNRIPHEHEWYRDKNAGINEFSDKTLERVMRAL